ncbi:hypothetical protein Emag_003536 [Eimeria magna]
MEDLYYLPLFSIMMFEAGTPEQPPEMLQPLNDRVTGGMKVSTTFRAVPAAPGTTAHRSAVKSFLIFSGKVGNCSAN